MSQLTPTPSQAGAASALLLLEEALQILDAVDAPSNIGAHVDLAICHLRDLLETDT